MALIKEQVKIFDEVKIDFQKEKMLKRPPFSNWIKGRDSGEKLEKLVDKAEGKVKSYISPQAIIHILRRRETDLADQAPPELLMSDYLVLGVVTIGERADKTPKRANLIEGLVTDALENVALMQAERKVVEFIMEIAAREKLNTTRITSPGSGRTRWGIKNQEFIFKNLQTEKIGVKLNPSFAMMPKKSLSFVIGLGRDIEQAKDMFSCEGCRRLDCSYRS